MTIESTGPRRDRRSGRRKAALPVVTVVTVVTVLPVVTALALCALYAGAELRPPAGELGLPLDDGWIHLQFASRLAAGDGLSYNPGTWVTGSTAPLWSALLATLFYLPGPLLLWVKLLGALLLAVAVDAARRLAAALGLSRGWSLLAAFMVAVSGWLVWSALSGMEVPLFLALSLWGMVLHLRARSSARRHPASAASFALFAAAALARPEGILLLLLATLDRALIWRRDAAGDGTDGADGDDREVLRPAPAPVRPWLEGLLLAALVMLPTLVFYRAIGDSWLPTTFAAKGGAPLRDPMPDGRYLRLAFDVLFRSQPVLLLAALAGALRLLARLGTPRDRGLLPALWLFGLPLAFSVLSGGGPPPLGNFGRYLFPLLPLVAILGLLGLESVAARLPRALRLGTLRLPLGALLVALLLLPQLAGVIRGRAVHARTVANVLDSDVAAARWLAPRLDPQALLAVQDIGALKFFLPNRVLDLAGIVTPGVVPLLRGGRGEGEGYWERRLLRFLERERPDYLVLFPAAYPLLGGGRMPGFTVVRTFDVESNLAMAGDRLAIVATPWNRYPLRP